MSRRIMIPLDDLQVPGVSVGGVAGGPPGTFRVGVFLDGEVFECAEYPDGYEHAGEMIRGQLRDAVVELKKRRHREGGAS